MYSQLSLLISALIYSTIHSLAVFKPPDLIISPTSLPDTNNLNTTFSVATIQHPRTNISDSPSNFLGVNCYHLLPADTVNLGTCQNLFAHLFRGGDAYEEHDWWNGWRFRLGWQPCTITLSSPDKQDRMVKMSTAEVGSYFSDLIWLMFWVVRIVLGVRPECV